MKEKPFDRNTTRWCQTWADFHKVALEDVIKALRQEQAKHGDTVFAMCQVKARLSRYTAKRKLEQLMSKYQ